MTKLASWMERCGVTDAKVADAIGISQPQVNRIRRGVNRPSPETAGKLERLTGIPAWDFLKPEASVTPVVSLAGHLAPSERPEQTATEGADLFGGLKVEGVLAVDVLSMPTVSHDVAVRDTRNETVFSGAAQ